MGGEVLPIPLHVLSGDRLSKDIDQAQRREPLGACQRVEEMAEDRGDRLVDRNAFLLQVGRQVGNT